MYDYTYSNPPTSWAPNTSSPPPPPADKFPTHSSLVHTADERVDLVFAVTSHTTFNVVLLLLGHTAVRGGELEGPQEVGALLEVRASGVDLVDQIFDANDTLGALPYVRGSLVLVTNEIGRAHV